MSFVSNLPSLKVRVWDEYLTDDPGRTESTEAYLVAVKSEINQALKFTVYLESGALWSGLTIDTLTCSRYPVMKGLCKVYSLQELQPYSCLSNNIQAIEYTFMKNYKGTFNIGKEKVSGWYLFTIETIGSGTLADDPEQFKTFNVVQLENSQLAALPNNFCNWDDDFFFDGEKAKDKVNYRRNSNYPLPGG